MLEMYLVMLKLGQFKRLLLFTTNRSDQLVWPYDRHDDYLVKSIYHVVRRVKVIS